MWCRQTCGSGMPPSRQTSWSGEAGGSPQGWRLCGLAACLRRGKMRRLETRLVDAKPCSYLHVPRPCPCCSELLGSFGDNELSPECLDGAQRFLKPDGVSIPQVWPLGWCGVRVLLFCRPGGA